MNKEDLIELREIFRKKFSEEDFCIGEGQVEKVFRELLGEPEPVIEYYNNFNSKVSAEDVANQLEELIPKIKDLFERDDTFYREMRKK